jgi:hypothetical protein
MLSGELDRQNGLKEEIAKDPAISGWLEEARLFQNYKQLQFCDTLALYFNRSHPGERGEQSFEHVPLNAQRDTTVIIRPQGTGVYALSPYPFASSGAEFAFGGRPIEPGQCTTGGGWAEVLRKVPTQWERFFLTAA